MTRILVTGAGGFIGRHVVTEMVSHGHAVTGVVRNQGAADWLRGLGAGAVIGDIVDVVQTPDVWAGHDCFIHLAATNFETERRVVAAVDRHLRRNQRWVHTAGIWMYGPGSELSEGMPPDPPAVAAWRLEIRQLLLTIALHRDVRVVSPAVVHGAGKCASLQRLLADAVLDGESLVLRSVGDGSQHWPTIHVEDLSQLYAAMATTAHAPREVIAASGENPTVGDLLNAMGNRSGRPFRVQSESPADSVERLGLVATAALLDQQASGSTARSLPWNPVHEGLLAQITAGAHDAAIWTIATTAVAHSPAIVSP